MKKIKFCDISNINIKKKKKKIFSRNSFILDCHVGHIFHVHRGNKFLLLKILPELIGFKFGDFILTRKNFSHKKKK